MNRLSPLNFARQLKGHAKKLGWLLNRYRRYRYESLWYAAEKQSPAWRLALKETNRRYVHSLPASPLSRKNVAFILCQRHHENQLARIASQFSGSPVECVLVVAENSFVPAHLPMQVTHHGELKHFISTLADSASYVCFLTPDDKILDGADKIVSKALTAPDGGAPDIIYTDYWLANNGQPAKAMLVPAWDPLYWHQSDYVSRACWFAADKVISYPVQRWSAEGKAVTARLLKAMVKAGNTIRHQPGLAFTLSQVSAGNKALIPAVKAAPGAVTIVIPTKDNVALLRQCILSITSRTDYAEYQILIINNQSADPHTLAYFDELIQAGHQVIDYPHPFNYSAINNFAIDHVKTDLIALVNDDIEVISPDWLSRMVHHAQRSTTGCVGAKLLYSNNKIQHAGVTLGIMGGAAHAYKYVAHDARGMANQLQVDHHVSAVTAACLVIRKSVFEEVGGLDAINLTVAFNDIDLCLKVAERGYQNIQCNTVSLYHHESQSRGEDLSPEKAARFAKEREYMEQRWGWNAKTDAYLSPLLYAMFRRGS